MAWLINLIIGVLVFCLLFWLVRKFLPVGKKAKNIINIILVILLILWLLRVFGIWAFF